VELQDIRSAWLQRASSLVLAVPSVIIATEFSYLINPRYLDFMRLKIQPATPFTFDGQL